MCKVRKNPSLCVLVSLSSCLHLGVVGMGRRETRTCKEEEDSSSCLCSLVCFFCTILSYTGRAHHFIKPLQHPFSLSSKMLLKSTQVFPLLQLPSNWCFHVPSTAHRCTTLTAQPLLQPHICFLSHSTSWLRKIRRGFPLCSKWVCLQRPLGHWGFSILCFLPHLKCPTLTS